MENLLIPIGGIFALCVIAIIVMFNGMIRLKNTTKESWSNIDIALKRRHDLIPNLIETVKGYAAHETQVLQQLTEARNQAARCSDVLPTRVHDEQVLSSALMGFFARVEAYPDLKANTVFLGLQGDLVDTEDKIAAARRFYNSNAKMLNSKVEQFPHSIIAAQCGIIGVPYFELENLAERERISVSFNRP